MRFYHQILKKNHQHARKIFWRNFLSKNSILNSFVVKRHEKTTNVTSYYKTVPNRLYSQENAPLCGACMLMKKKNIIRMWKFYKYNMPLMLSKWMNEWWNTIKKNKHKCKQNAGKCNWWNAAQKNYSHENILMVYSICSEQIKLYSRRNQLLIFSTWCILKCQETVRHRFDSMNRIAPSCIISSMRYRPISINHQANEFAKMKYSLSNIACQTQQKKKYCKNWCIRLNIETIF